MIEPLNTTARPKLIVGSKYRTQYGILTYSGFYRIPGFYCDGCDRERPAVHEFLKGDYPHHTHVFMYGSECVKKLELARVEEKGA